jgi:hypothetical protein
MVHEHNSLHTVRVLLTFAHSPNSESAYPALSTSSSTGGASAITTRCHLEALTLLDLRPSITPITPPLGYAMPYRLCVSEQETDDGATCQAGRHEGYEAWGPCGPPSLRASRGGLAIELCANGGSQSRTETTSDGEACARVGQSESE